jgi:hypothetical protein
LLGSERLLVWSAWIPHQGCWRGDGLPNEAGVYRIRRVGEECLDYIGQTGKGGMTLRKRLGMQQGVYADEMPYTNPHTAAPALWAIRRMIGAQYEVSVAVVSGPIQWRKGVEALTIALHRQRFGRSPTVNFGRMPAGFRKSSGNNRKLLLAGKRFRGGACDTVEAHHAPGVPPAGPLTGDPQGSGWGRHSWSGWQPLVPTTALPPAAATGLYRIRDAVKPDLLYIGEGLVAARLLAHQQKTRKPDPPQGAVFRDAARLECSWVLNDDWGPHQRLELECDLIGAHLLNTGVVPPAQFIG